MSIKEVAIQFINEVYISLRYSLKDITIFPGKNLVHSLVIAASITVLAWLVYLFKYYNFINPIGATLGTVILGVIYYIGERGENGKVRDVSSDGDCSGVVREREQETGSED
jgi:hypothetical protein